MPPKTEKRKISLEEKVISLDEPINTEDWKCTVMLLLECSSNDVPLTKIFAESAASCSRKEIRSISFENDVMAVLKQFVAGEVSSRFSYLLNYSALFEEAIEYFLHHESIPSALMAKIVRVMVMWAKKNAIDRSIKDAECNNDPIEIMASKPMFPMQATLNPNNGKDKGNDKKKLHPEVSTTKATLRVRVSTTGKEDTKLLKRGEISKNIVPIDDAPQNGYYNLYVALVGFHDPDLALEIIKADVPLHSVVCLDSHHIISENRSSRVVVEGKELQWRLDKFWDHFISSLWNPDNTQYFRDIVFQLYRPQNLPQDLIELKDFLYTEISMLLYDLSDFNYQLIDYLKHMELWNVEEGPDRVPILAEAVEELDQMPYECIDFPLILQYIFDNICDDEFEGDETENMFPEGSESIHTPSSYMSDLKEEDNSTLSFVSLIPFQSTVKLPTPKWSNFINSDHKQVLYDKIRDLDLFYGIEDPENYWQEVESKIIEPCATKRKRVPCANLEAEARYKTGGMVARYWDNYPKEILEDDPTTFYPGIHFPEFNMNYLLYIVWMTKMEKKCLESNSCSQLSNPSLAAIAEGGTTHFTVTDCSRTALEKSLRVAYGKDFFLPEQLKIVPQEVMMALSSPELRPPPKITWTYKSFVSDSHIPKKFLEGTALTVFDDLRQFIGQEKLATMKDYDFIEELNGPNLIRRIEDIIDDYDCVYHSYSPLTDSIYIFLYDRPSVDGIYRETYNVTLRTPVGLRDFYDYIVDDEKEWLEARKPLLAKNAKKRISEQCPNTLYNPTPDFRDFIESDFWIEDSIKYKYYAQDVLTAIADKVEEAVPLNQNKVTSKENTFRRAKKKLIHAAEEPPPKFVGFDVSNSAVQFSGVRSVYRAPDECSVEVSLQERLYGAQELGVHVRKGGHSLHLYSYVCPEPHVNQPYLFHVQFRNGIVVAFSRRVTQSIIETMEELLMPQASIMLAPAQSRYKSTSEDRSMFFSKTVKQIPVTVEDKEFAYDMKLSLPNGLTVETVRKHVQPCYIKQSYVTKPKNCSQTVRTERSRLFLPNGSIIKMMSNNTVEILKCDTSIVTASLQHLVKTTTHQHSDIGSLGEAEGDYGVSGGGDDEDDGSPWFFQSYCETMMNGYHYEIVDGKIKSTTRYQIFRTSDMETQSKYFRRTDSTNYVMLVNGTVCVEFADGSKICCEIYEEDFYPDFEYDDEFVGEGMPHDVFVLVHRRIIMEHPEYATAVFDGRDHSWSLILPRNSVIDITSAGNYHIEIDDRTELDLDTERVSMWRHKGDRFIMRTLADFSVFREGSPPDAHYCLSIDSSGKTFAVDKRGHCKMLHECLLNRDDSSSMSGFEIADNKWKKLKRYFVVRRDFSGFEIMHTRCVEEDLNSHEPGSIAYCQEVDSVIGHRYFTLIQEAVELGSKWLVKSITPDVKYKSGMKKATTSSTYGNPPSWMHPFPKKRKRLEIPDALSGRVLLEIHPSNCPSPFICGREVAFCDASHLNEPTISLTENVPEVIKRIADQDEELLREIYIRSLMQRIQSNKLCRPKDNPNLEHYLKMSQYHVNLRETLKNAIRFKIIPGYFNSPQGMAWLFIQSIIESIIRVDGLHRDRKALVEAQAESSEVSSEVEYNLEWESEKSFSDLSYRSNLSLKTAPPAIMKLPVCRHLLNTPREVKSEPIYKMADFVESEKIEGYDSFLYVPSSRVCVYTKEDLHELEKKNPPQADEPKHPQYGIEDLVRLGLV